MCINYNSNPYIEIDDSTSTYCVNIKEFRKAGTTSPIEFEKERIKQMILHKRKIELITRMEEP